MSIDAKIAAVQRLAPEHCEHCGSTGKDPTDNWDLCPKCHGANPGNPVVRLLLEPREKGGCAGQDALTIIDCPTLSDEELHSFIGVDIWGGTSEIMIGDTKWADRVGYTRIKLVSIGESE